MKRRRRDDSLSLCSNWLFQFSRVLVLLFALDDRLCSWKLWDKDSQQHHTTLFFCRWIYPTWQLINEAGLFVSVGLGEDMITASSQLHFLRPLSAAVEPEHLSAIDVFMRLFFFVCAMLDAHTTFSAEVRAPAEGEEEWLSNRVDGARDEKFFTPCQLSEASDEADECVRSSMLSRFVSLSIWLELRRSTGTAGLFD